MCGVAKFHNYYNVEQTIHDEWHALPFMEIKIRPLNCSSH